MQMNDDKFSIMAGPEIFFNSSVGLEILLGYKATTQTIDNSPTGFSDAHKGFQISVGFQIHLQKNKNKNYETFTYTIAFNNCKHSYQCSKHYTITGQ
jgi:hypothetical protein